MSECDAVSGPSVVATRSLAVGFGGSAVLDGLDLRLGGGEALALVGTNGSGKSTLLKTLAGLLAPIGGEVEVLGQAPGALPRRVAYLGQTHAHGYALPLRVRDVVRMGRFANHGLVGRMGRADRAAVEEAMRRTGVDALAERSVADLSGGQRQRTYLAQALVRGADLLLLDEPTAGIDVAGQGVYEQVLAEELGRGAAVVVATHDLGEAERSDVVVLLAGRVIAAGRPSEVLTAERLFEAFGAGRLALSAGLVELEEPHAHEPPRPASGPDR